MTLKDEFEKVYIDYSDRIFRYLYIKTSDKNLAEDLTGEVFIKAWKSWKKIQKTYIQAWLYKIAHNTLVDYWRKKKGKEISLEIIIEQGKEPEKEEDFIEKIYRDDELKKIDKAIKSLPENLKDVVILRFIEDYSAKETAQVLKISEVNVRVLQYRALKKLKEILK